MSNLDFCSNTSVGTSNKHMVQGDEQPPYTDSKRAAGDRLYNRPKKKKKLVKRLKWPMFKFGQGLWVQHVSTCFNYACDLCHVGRSFSHPSSEKAMFHQTAPKRPKQHVLPQIGFGTSAPPKKGSGPHLGGSRVAFGQFIVGYKMWTSD